MGKFLTCLTLLSIVYLADSFPQRPRDGGENAESGRRVAPLGPIFSQFFDDLKELRAATRPQLQRPHRITPFAFPFIPRLGQSAGQFPRVKPPGDAVNPTLPQPSQCEKLPPAKSAAQPLADDTLKQQPAPSKSIEPLAQVQPPPSTEIQPLAQVQPPPSTEIQPQVQVQPPPSKEIQPFAQVQPPPATAHELPENQTPTKRKNKPQIKENNEPEETPNETDPSDNDEDIEQPESKPRRNKNRHNRPREHENKRQKNRNKNNPPETESVNEQQAAPRVASPPSSIPGDEKVEDLTRKIIDVPCIGGITRAGSCRQSFD